VEGNFPLAWFDYCYSAEYPVPFCVFYRSSRVYEDEARFLFDLARDSVCDLAIEK
jgi:hypothetical protein